MVHAQEFLSPDGCAADRAAIGGLVNDHEITAWLDDFDPALLPVKRLAD